MLHYNIRFSNEQYTVEYAFKTANFVEVT